MTPHALIVHNDRSAAELRREILDSSGFECRVATGLNGAVSALRSNAPRIAIAQILSHHKMLLQSFAQTPAQNPQLPIAMGMIGESTALREALAQKAARSEANIFLCGESGTGKELAAKAIHDASARAGRALVAVELGALRTRNWY